MRRLFPAVILLILVSLIISACGGSAATPASSVTATGGTATGLSLAAAPWSATDRELFQQQGADGASVGTIEYTMANDGTNWVIREKDVVGQATIDGKMVIAGDTLKPISEDRSIKSTDSNVQLQTQYASGKLNITATVNGEKKTASVDVPADALDNDQLLTTLRALDLKEGLEETFTLVVSASAQVLPATVRVLGKESVTVPAGKFDAWKTEIELSQGKLTLWYGVDAPHHLVQYEGGGTKLVLAEKAD